MRAALLLAPCIALASATPSRAGPADTYVQIEFKIDPTAHPAADWKPVFALPFVTNELAGRLDGAGIQELRRLVPRGETGRWQTNLLGEPAWREDLSNTFLARLKPSVSAITAVTELSLAPEIRRAVPDRTYPAAQFTPNDSLFAQQWFLYNTGSDVCGYPAAAAADARASLAWDETLGALSDTVAVLDTGVDIDHPELSGKVGLGPAFWTHPPGVTTSIDTTRIQYCSSPLIDVCRHGTAVAGIIAARANNVSGGAGVAPGAAILAVRVLSPQGNGIQSECAAAIEHVRQRGIPIVNLSLGFPGYESTPALEGACRNAFYSGQLLTAAMGNLDEGMRMVPGGYAPWTFAVGATMMNGRRWQDVAIWGAQGYFGSSFGPWIDVSGAGGALVVAPRYSANDRAYPPYYSLDDCTVESHTMFSGTSSSTPVVSGVAALLRARQPTLLGEDLAEVLRRTARDISPSGFDDSTGAGLVQADAALAFVDPDSRTLVQESIGWQGAASGSLAFLDSTVTTRMFVGVPGIADGAHVVTRCQLRGHAEFGTQFSGVPDLWIRGSGSIGWRDRNIIDFSTDVMGGQIVPGSVTTGDFSVVTTVYRVHGVGWFPGTLEEARIAYTAIGSNAIPTVSVPREQSLPGLVVSYLGADPRRGIRLRGEALEGARVEIVSVTGRVVYRRRPASGDAAAGVEIGRDELRDHRVGKGIYFVRVVGVAGAQARKVLLLP